MKVSIIIPVYDKEPYIERCINSVLNQTYRQLEVILVNDYTPCESMKLAKKVIEQSELSKGLSFKYIYHQAHRGLSATRNSGIEAATGEYLFFLDSDDTITPSCISLMVEQAKAHPDVEVIQGHVVSVPDKKGYHTETLNSSGYREDNLWYCSKFNQNGNFPINAWNKLIKRDFVIRNNLFFMDGIIHEDLHWMFYVAKCVKKYAFIPENTYIHYITPNSIMTNLNIQKSCDSIAKILYDVIPVIDFPCRNSKFNKMIRLFLSGYISRGGNSEKNRLVRMLFVRMLKEGMPKGALLLFCTIHLSTIKGGWRFKKWLNLYLDQQSVKDSKNLNNNPNLNCSK